MASTTHRTGQSGFTPNPKTLPEERALNRRMRKHTFLRFFHFNCLLICSVLFFWLCCCPSYAYLPLWVWLICCAFGNFVVFSVNVSVICTSGPRHLKQSSLHRGDSREVPWEVGVTGDRFLRFPPNTAALKNETQRGKLIRGFKMVSLTQHEIEDWLFLW